VDSLQKWHFDVRNCVQGWHFKVWISLSEQSRDHWSFSSFCHNWYYGRWNTQSADFTSNLHLHVIICQFQFGIHCAEATGWQVRQRTHAIRGQFLHIFTTSKAAADQKDASLWNSATKMQTLAWSCCHSPTQERRSHYHILCCQYSYSYSYLEHLVKYLWFSLSLLPINRLPVEKTSVCQQVVPTKCFLCLISLCICIAGVTNSATEIKELWSEQEEAETHTVLHLCFTGVKYCWINRTANICQRMSERAVS